MSLFSLLLFISVVASFLGSVVFWQPTSALKEILTANQKYPFYSKNHQRLAQIYTQMRQNSKSEKELHLATQYQGREPNAAVLGRQDSQNAQNTFIDQINYWETITTTYPNYKDGWLQLLILAKNSHDEDLFNKSWKELLKLAPEYAKNPILYSDTP